MPVASIFFPTYSVSFCNLLPATGKYGNSFPYYKEEKRHIHTKNRISTRFSNALYCVRSMPTRCLETDDAHKKQAHKNGAQRKHRFLKKQHANDDRP